MVRSLLRPLLATALLLSSLFGAAPAWAAVTITFWSHELGNSFPHAFFTLRGVPDAGGAPVDANYGFTAKSVSPKLLLGTVAGRLDISKPFYIAGSDAQFTLVKMHGKAYLATLPPLATTPVVAPAVMAAPAAAATAAMPVATGAP